MSQLYILFEHAAGYSLFQVEEFEEIGMLLPQVEQSVTDYSKFKSIIKLVGFSPFKVSASALENVNSVSEGILHDDLQLFLENNLPKSSKKSKLILGVAEPKLGSAISEVLKIKCQHTDVVPEILRGIRHHFSKLVKGFTDDSSGKAQLGLGHSYSRAKVKFNINRVDNMIIHSISCLDQLDKDINTFAMRLREWYSYHFPELIRIVPDSSTYARLVKYIKDRKNLDESNLEELENIVMDESKAREILEASRSSMGMDITPVDLMNIESFANRMVSFIDYRRKLHSYLKDKMGVVAPNLCTLIGEQVGARLIAHAGSLTNLAKYPASTVQILGAEKALFRALKTRGSTPKYGLIFHSTFIGRASGKDKGRISRYLANKCSIASRLDCFLDKPTSVFGESLKEQVEERLKFYSTGEFPRPNIAVMHDAIEKFKTDLPEKKESKKRKRKSKGQNVAVEAAEIEEVADTNGPKKKNKQKNSVNV
ncbi:snoRNP complex protein nop56 [Chamberlinius hualienensis]